MTNVFLTIDTELTSGLHRRGMGLADNLDVSIHARCPEGDFGVAYQARRLEGAGLKAVFFIDPVPALIYGTDFLKPIVGEVLTRGHEVQLHLHTEWLDMVEKPPVGGRGQHIGQFDPGDQFCLISCATELLCAAGAPEPIAFRAGNFGADDSTLSALHRLDIPYDTSFNPVLSAAQCQISLGRNQAQPILHKSVLELPVSCISDWPGHIRPAQLAALSAWEMRSALSHSAETGQTAFTIVSHSFELIERGAGRPRWGGGAPLRGSMRNARGKSECIAYARLRRCFGNRVAESGHAGAPAAESASDRPSHGRATADGKRQTVTTRGPVTTGRNTVS